MAQHDYVIDNSTGANVRSDINSALQAIVTNNSGSSAPSTTYALQTFANTTDSMLQLRNAANNAFVNLRKFDGSLPLPDGSASSPSLFFDDDTNTGIFSSAADTLNFTTGGVERMELGAVTVFNEDGADVDFRIEGDTQANLFYVDAGNNRIGIGTNSPDVPLTTVFTNNNSSSFTTGAALASGANANLYALHLQNTGTGNSESSLLFSTGDTQFAQWSLNCIKTGAFNGDLAFRTRTGSTTSAERMRIDSSGRLLIGTSSSRAFNTHASRLQIEGTDYSSSTVSITNNTNDSNGAFLFFMKQRSGSSGGNTAANSGDIIGELRFSCADGTNFDNVGARIQVSADGSVSSNNTPTRMVFQTNSGTTSPSERLRIESNGDFEFDGIGTAVPGNGNSTTGMGFEPRNGSIFLSRSDAACLRTNINATNTDIVQFSREGTTRGRVFMQTTTVSYTTSSDYRLKENQVLISDGITRLKTLKPYRFNFIEEPSKTVDGFFAHEVTAVPEAVSGTKDAVDSDGNIEPQGLDYGRITPLLTAALQEAIAKIEVLETKVAALETA